MSELIGNSGRYAYKSDPVEPMADGYARQLERCDVAADL